MNDLLATRMKDASLFLAHLTSTTPQAYNLIVNCCVHGEIDARRLSECIEKVFIHHRLHEHRFEPGSNSPSWDADTLPRRCEVAVRECSSIEDAESVVHSIVKLEKEFAFDIGDHMLFRNTIVVAPDRAFWLLNVHHGISDGWSISLLIDQVERCYTQDTLPCVLASSRKVSDNRDLAFWRETFETARRNLERYTERPGSARSTRHDHRYVGQDSERIYAFCRQHSLSLNDFFTGILAAYLFHTHSLQQVTFEVSLHGRATTEDKQRVGKYVKFVPLNLDLSADVAFVDLCKGIRSGNRQLLRHHRFDVHGSNSRQHGLIRPDIPFAVNYQNSKHTSRFAGYRFDVNWIFTGYDEHWLTLNINDFQDDDITLSVDLNDDAFDFDTQPLVLQRLVTMSEFVLERNPSIGSIAPLCDVDRAVLDDLRNVVAASTNGLFHLDWLATAPRFPTANAVIVENLTLSHAEFRARISNCREALRVAECSSGDRVTMCLDNGWSSLAWVFAIWLESGVYVPIDYDTPRERVNTIITTASSSLLISDRADLQGIAGCLMLPAEPVGVDASHDAHAGDGSVDPETIAYILFTSGSTGVPKGVMVSHQAISEYASQFVTYFALRETDTVLQQASLAFDASFEEFVPVLAAGGSVVAWNRYRLLEFNRLRSVLSEHNVSVISVSPALMGELNQQFERVPSLRIAISGGDVLEWSQCDRLVEDGVAVYNTYGPTEATICATYKHVDSACITLGRPIRNTNVYVLNEQGGMVGVGVPGELAISGVGVAQGYLDDPEISALRFRANPYATSTRDRTLYLTGDRAMVTSSAEIVFLGRTDDQVSINGYRVELREVEAGISSCPGVNSRAVLFDAASQRLVGCYTGAAEISEVKVHLQKCLPKHMIPHGWHRLQAMPLNQNGKLDLKRLREVCLEKSTENLVSEGALSEFASQVAALWREVLRCDVHIDPSSCFFALGGSSLKLLELLRAYEKRLGATCALGSLLSDSTLSSHVSVLVSRQPDAMPAFARFAPIARWPATHQQRAMIHEERGSGRTGLYNVPAIAHWTGELDRSRFASTLEILRQRHPILQCEWHADGMFACAPERSIKLTFESIEHSGSDDRWLSSSQLSSLTTVDLLSAGRLPWSVSVFEHDAAHYTILFLFHHALVDAWSLRLLDEEFQQIYSELGQCPIGCGSARCDTVPAYDFSSYAQWIASTSKSIPTLEQKTIVQSFGQWHELFAFDATADSGTAPAVVHEWCAPTPWSERLTTFCAAHRVSLHNLLQSMFALALCRWMDVPSVVMGLPISHRDNAISASVVGCFINTVLVRTCPDANDTVLDLLHRSAEDAQRRESLTSIPLQQVIGCLLDAGCHVPPSPLEVFFALDDIPRLTHERDGRLVQPVSHSLEPGRSSISLVVIAAGDRWRLQWKSSGRHFDAQRVARLAGFYEHLLNDAISTPTIRLRDMALLDWTQGRILSTEPPCDVEQTLIGRIAEQVVRQPHAYALIAGSHRYTYLALWQKAARYASVLRFVGVQPGDFVVLALDKSPAFVQLALAAWIIGAGVCPQDRDFRLDVDEVWCAENAVSLIVHDRNFEPERRPARGMPLDALDALASAETNPAFVQPFAHLDAQAYRIYTSGSTGVPKGVDVSHRNLANFELGFRRQLAALGISALTTWLWHHSFAFDASMKGYAALAMGATVVLPAAVESRSPEALVGHVAENALDVVNFIPSQLRFVLPLLREQGLRVHVISSGDRIDPALESDMLEYCDWAGTRAINAYGPTETTVNATYGLLKRGQRVSLGRPMSNLCAWVVGRWGTPQPPGATGELWIGGESVASGYRGHDALTADKFVSIHMDDGPLRCYRTGDAVWLDEHGDIVFLGRVDRQTKVRGYRVELAGVEAVARALTGVNDCAAFCADEAVQLAVVAESGIDVVNALHARLQRELPSYMVPSHIYLVADIPYAHSGKLDIRHLQQLDNATATNGARDALSSLFGLPSLDLAKSFMQNGGNSMKALSLQAEIVRRWGRRISLEPLFADVPLTTLVEQWALESLDGPVPDPVPSCRMLGSAVQANTRDATAEENAMWLAHHADASGVAYNMPVWLHVTEDIPVSAWSDAYRRMLLMHTALTSCFVLEQGRLIVRYGDPHTLPLAIHFLELPSPTEPGMVDAIDSVCRPFDLGTPCLHRMIVIRHADGSTSLFFNIHHILVDGTSVSILQRDLFNGLGSSVQPVQRGSEFVVQSPRASLNEQDLSFWRAYLKSCVGTCFPRRATMSTTKVIEVATELTREATTSLLDACRLATVTPFQWLLTQVALHLGRHLGADDIVLLSPLETRTSEMTDVVGPYVRTLAYRIRWQGNETFGALALQQRQQILAVWQHGSPGVDELRHQLAGELPRPLTEAGFTWHGERSLADASHGFTVAMRALPLRALKYPFWLHARLIDGRLRIELESRSDIFDSRGASHFLDSFVDALQFGSKSPDVCIGTLPLSPTHVARQNTTVTFDFDF